MAWLLATLESKDEVKTSRLQKFGAESAICEMPDADPLIVKLFSDIGRCSTNGMGLTAFSFAELESFNNMMNLSLSAWESEQLIMMSREYVTMSSLAKDPDCECPWHGESYNDEIATRAFAEKQLSWMDNI